MFINELKKETRLKHQHRGGNDLFFEALQLKNATKLGTIEKKTIVFILSCLIFKHSLAVMLQKRDNFLSDVHVSTTSFFETHL